MFKKILPKKLIEKFDQNKAKHVLKKRVSDARINMLVERAVFYGYKPFNFRKFCFKVAKVLIGPVCALSLAIILFAATFFGANITLGDENANQEPFAINEYNAINAKNKNEMVIGSADANGLVYEIKDRVILSGVDEHSAYTKDKTNLTDIENISGDEKLEMHDGYVYFENKNKDIMYEGTSKEKMPVGVSVSYYLDGKKVSPDKIAGKSGHVIIRFDYTNSTLYTEYVPYIAMSAVVLDAEKFSNIKTNANVISTGYNVLAYGGTIPGFKEYITQNGHGDINIDVDNYVQIEADTTNFSIDYTYTIFTQGFSKLIKDETLNQIDSASKVSSIDIPTDQITTYISEILDGTDVFADAMKKLEEGSEKLTDASGKVAIGSAELKDGAKDLSNGIRSLADGAAMLADGSKEAVSGADELVEGAGEYKTGLDDYAQGVKDLNEGIAELNSKLTFMPGLSNTLKEIAEFLSDVENFTEIISSYSEVINAAIENSYLADDNETAQKLQSLLSELSSDGFFMTNMHSIVTRIADMLYEIADEVDALYGAATKIGEGSQKLADSSDDLKQAYGDLHTGVTKLGDGINKMDENITGLNAASEDAADGAETIAIGSANVSEAVNQLDVGINDLSNGIKDVNKGFAEFRKGILNLKSIKIGGSIYTKSDNLRYLINRIKQMKQSDGKYFSFSGADANITGETTYVIKTDGF